jgi:DNA (cytosine-5)-methyltransferase 1
VLTSIEICSGAGGQALGLERAGFEHLALVELEPQPCQTLRFNRPQWPVFEADVHEFSALPYRDEVDLFAGGVPCPPFSLAGKQLGADDERDLFPEALRLIGECRPRAIMLENVRGLLSPKFETYRASLNQRLEEMGYSPQWQLLQAADYLVPQLRPRVVCVALPIGSEASQRFAWPQARGHRITVGEALESMMGAAGWEGAGAWAAAANEVAPTLVGGSKKHGGADLGPTRAKAAWAQLGVNGLTLAEDPPPPGFVGSPRLTVAMAAVIQGFPPDWVFCGRKTAAYRQVGNAFPPPVAMAVGRAIATALS